MKNRKRSLAFLSLLAALVPLFAIAPLSLSAADDAPGTETDEEKKKREDEEAKKKAEDEKKKDDESKAKAAKPGLSACLKAALASLQGGTPAVAAAALTAEQSAHAATKATLTQVQADLTTAKASLSSTETTLAAVCDFFGLKPTDVAGLTAEKVHGVLQAKISASAVEIVAGIGINPEKTPAPSKADAPTTRAELLRQYNAITNPQERGEFYAKHKAALFGEPAKK